jgi:Ala-tRNA(Pro) deacylase
MAELRCAERVRELLLSRGVHYEVTEHRTTYTAQEMAAAEGVPGREVAKSVMLMADGELVMAVLAAPDHVSLGKAGRALGRTEVRLATEDEFSPAFGDCEVGAAPPFGGVYGVPTVIDSRLLQADTIVFAAGSHTHTMHLTMQDYLDAAAPRPVEISA